MSRVECEPCGRSFAHDTHYISHMVDSPRHHYCEPCRRDFASEAAKKTHLDHSERHMVCKWCHTLVGKLRTHNERNHSKCSVCDEWFVDQEHLHRHHKESHSAVYCAPCKRVFQKPHDLEMHEMSSFHLPKTFKCPHGSCVRAFASAPALVGHFEAGRCKSGIDLEDVMDYFSQLANSQYFITKRMIKPREFPDVTPDKTGLYRCPLCPKCFKYPGQLTQHLRSPKHLNQGRKPFFCPSDDCGSRFNSLSGLLLHRQWGNCTLGFDHELSAVMRRLLDVVLGL